MNQLVNRNKRRYNCKLKLVNGLIVLFYEKNSCYRGSGQGRTGS